MSLDSRTSTELHSDTGGAATSDAPDQRELTHGLVQAALAALAGWLSLATWGGLADASGQFLTPLAILATANALTGWLIRSRTKRFWPPLAGQIVVSLEILIHEASGSWLPRLGGFLDVVDRAIIGAQIAQTTPSPIPASNFEYHFLLTVSGLGVLLAFDFVACTLRKPAAAGMALLLAITVSTALLLQATQPLLFVGCVATWLALVALRENEELGNWQAGPVQVPLSAAAGSAVGIGLVGVFVAIVMSSPLSSQGRQFGSLGQGANVIQMGGVNPLLDMQRNLNQGADIDMVRISSDTQPRYLKTTTLEEFTGTSWQPKEPTEDNTTPLGQVIPRLDGLDPRLRSPTETWQIRTAANFSSKYLPIGYPPTGISGVREGWRIDPLTHDVIAVDDTTAAGLSYTVRTFEPRFAGEQVIARSIPAQIRGDMTALPTDLPSVFQQTAEQVTSEATNPFDRAILLQRWFTETGDFTYTTRRSPGSGIDTLTAFVTNDREGYCEQFAAAYAVMARSLGLPTRIAVGFLAPEREGDDWVFSTHDAHAWPEVYFGGVGWIRFEPTPASHTGSGPGYTDELVGDRASLDVSTSAEPTAQPSQVAPSRAPQNPEQSDQAGQDANSGWWPRLGYGALGLFAVLTAVLLPRLVRLWRTRQRWSSGFEAGSDASAVAEAAWAEVRDYSTDLGLDFSEQRSVRANGAMLSRLAGHSDGASAIDDVITFVELTRYGRPRTLDQVELDEIRRKVEIWHESAPVWVGPQQARRAKWWPKSVVQRSKG